MATKKVKVKKLKPKVFTKSKGKKKVTSPVLMMKFGEALPMSIARWRRMGWDAPEDLDAYIVDAQTVSLV